MIEVLFYTSPKSWKGCIFTAICLCVSVRLCMWTKFQLTGFINLDAFFCYTVAYHTGSDPIEIGDLGSKVKVTVTQYPFIHLHEIVEGLYFHCSLSVCLCVCVCVCDRICLWTKFQPNRWTDLDAVFAKWLLTALAQTLLNLVTLGQRSRSQWRNTNFFFIIIC